MTLKALFMMIILSISLSVMSLLLLTAVSSDGPYNQHSRRYKTLFQFPQDSSKRLEIPDRFIEQKNINGSSMKGKLMEFSMPKRYDIFRSFAKRDLRASMRAVQPVKQCFELRFPNGSFPARPDQPPDLTKNYSALAEALIQKILLQSLAKKNADQLVSKPLSMHAVISKGETALLNALDLKTKNISERQTVRPRHEICIVVEKRKRPQLVDSMEEGWKSGQISADRAKYTLPHEEEALKSAFVEGLEDAYLKMSSSSTPGDESGNKFVTSEEREQNFTARITDPLQILNVLCQALNTAWSDKMCPASDDEVTNFDIHLQVIKPGCSSAQQGSFKEESFPLLGKLIPGGVKYPISISAGRLKDPVQTISLQLPSDVLTANSHLSGQPEVPGNDWNLFT